MDDNIKIRVGDVVYHSKRKFLLNEEDSMLAKMFSVSRPWRPSDTDNDGAFLIPDRNALLFGYILDYLAKFPLGSDEEETDNWQQHFLQPHSVLGLEQLQREADYFQLQGFKALVDKEKARQIRSLEQALRERDYARATTTSETGCLVEFPNAQVGDRIHVGARICGPEIESDLSGTIVSINRNGNREATVKWSAPKCWSKIFEIHANAFFAFFLIVGLACLCFLLKGVFGKEAIVAGNVLLLLAFSCPVLAGWKPVNMIPSQQSLCFERPIEECC